MARIKNIDLPKNKRIVVALTYIYGIGPTRAHKICEGAKVNEDVQETTVGELLPGAFTTEDLENAGK